ncbi:hypothetical protein B0H12DRAFT_1323044 [Mycena haematopus]|nr:hypothetical protein B0H12DRAFT_1323044 [Mycena haematopus]
MDVDPVSPALPAELERAIFEMAAFFWPRSIPKFMLVALRIKTWLVLSLLEPVLYRIIILDRSSSVQYNIKSGDGPPTIKDDTLISLIRSKPSAFFRNSTRHLCVARDLEEEGAIILSACSAIENLWLAAQTRANVLEVDMRLKRLHCMLSSIFGASQIDLTHRLFSSITHLEIFDVWSHIAPEFWSALKDIPNLTHLAFNDPNYLPQCHTLLPTWESLRVLVILLLTDSGAELVQRYNVPELAQELRFVVIVCPDYLEDWIDGAHMNRDYWLVAEDLIVKRKSGEINPLNYYISDTVDSDTDAVSSDD